MDITSLAIIASGVFVGIFASFTGLGGGIFRCFNYKIPLNPPFPKGEI